MCSNFHKLLKLIPDNTSRVQCIHRYIYKMDKAYFRNLNDTNQFRITFQYTNPDFKVDRQFNFCRSITETVDTFLSRIGTNVEKVINKKNKKKKCQEDPGPAKSLNVELLMNDTPVQGDAICQDIFNPENSIILKLLEKQYRVIINSPWVDSIALPSSMLANFPMYPCKFEVVSSDKALSEFIWYKSDDKANWTQTGVGFMYVPSNEVISKYLKISCTPKNNNAEGPTIEAVSDVKVEAGPGCCPFETRHQFTIESLCGNEFRVVSYNILADLYCDSDFTRTTLFPYCPPYALNIDYRKQLILKEILGYNADIICLQEVDKKVYLHDLEPVLANVGYDSSFQLKGGQVAEGLACFFNSKRFRKLSSSYIVFGEELNKSPIFANVWENVARNEKLTDRILQRTTTLQTTTLECIERDEILLVANTHLYFHPDADHIRLLQGGLAIRYIQNIIDTLRTEYKKKISLIFCGDFNSVPECGIYQLYTTGKIGRSCIDWKSNIEEAVEGVTFEQPFQLGSACGTPNFTNYTAGFAGCLDYIFYDKTSLEVTQVIPLPSNEEIMQYTALPSPVFPSDHIALISDLKWI